MSHWQGAIGWRGVASAGVDAAYIRATMGAAGIDPRFAENAEGAREYMPIGFYHLLRPESDGVAQARHFLRTVEPYLFRSAYGYLPLAVDVELDGSDTEPPQPQTPARIADVLLAFVQTVEAETGRKPVIYTGAWFWTPKVGHQHDSVFVQCPLWIAHYNVSAPTIPRPWDRWWLWQYSSSGSVVGIAGRVDMNRVNEETHRVMIDVPYVSQVSNTAALSSGDCGIACVAMLAAWNGTNRTVDQLVRQAGLPVGREFYTFNELRQAGQVAGLDLVYSDAADWEAIRMEIDTGNPVIVLNRYGEFSGNQDDFTGAHFFVVIGYDGDTVYVNDPLFWGGRIDEGKARAIPLETFKKAIGESLVNANRKPHQALFIR